MQVSQRYTPGTAVIINIFIKIHETFVDQPNNGLIHVTVDNFF